MTKEIIKDVLKVMPKGVISDTGFEGATIVLYTRDKEFFLDCSDVVRKAVGIVKKRIEVRPDPSLCVPKEEAEEIIKKIVPQEAKIDQIIFDECRSRVIIEAEKPGSVIGKGGETLYEIKKHIFWAPLIKRTPPIRSPILENIRATLYQNSDYRRKFLDETGKRIYTPASRTKKHDWVRLTYPVSYTHLTLPTIA